MILWSAPLMLIYQQENISEAIATAIQESKKQKIHYREIKRRVEHILGHTISHRKLLKHLSTMVDERILQKEDPTGKRGSKVYFELTNNGKRKYHLRILGQGQVEKRRGLYHLLIFFEVFKRMSLMSERRLLWFLRQINASKKDLVEVGKKDTITMFGRSVTFFQPIKGVDIIRFNQPNSKNSPKMPFLYYTVIPGFSIEEIIVYLDLLKRGINPRPFSKYSSIPRIPSVIYRDYSEREVKEAIDFLKDDGIIKPIQEVFPDELRYDIADNSLKHLIVGVWLIHIIDFELLIAMLAHERKPTETEKQYLRIFLGNKGTGRFLAHAHDFRRKRESINNTKQFIKEWEKKRDSLIHEIKKKHERLIQENEVIAEVIEGVCSSPIFSYGST